MLKKHVFGSFKVRCTPEKLAILTKQKNILKHLKLNISGKHRLFLEDIFWGTLDTYTKKLNPLSAVQGGGEVHGKV